MWGLIVISNHYLITRDRAVPLIDYPAYILCQYQFFFCFHIGMRYNMGVDFIVKRLIKSDWR